MSRVKTMVEKILQDPKLGAQIDSQSTSSLRPNYRIPGPSRVHVRQTLSHYLGNHSPFALDLSAAAIRQAVFTEKMAAVNWLHSPDSRATILQKCILKYTRFVRISADNPDKLVVPTLDVDLAWHTHQLSPASYYAYTVSKTGRFLNHDDKVRDETLGEGFEFTAQAYQDLFKEVYSECVCWYCEAVRVQHIKGSRGGGSGSIVGKLFSGISSSSSSSSRPSAEKINEDFHASLSPSAKDPETSPHLSSHHAARVKEDGAMQLRLAGRARALHRQMLEEAYQKACKLAKKKGRPLPKKELYYDHWGATFAMYSPFMYPVMAYPGLYAGGRDPGTAYGGDSQTGSCAMGTCGVGPKSADCLGGGSCGGSANMLAFV